MWIFEESIRLRENVITHKNNSDNSRFRNTYWHELVVEVPPNIRKITMCAIHSDDYSRIPYPSLHTYLRIKALKETNNTEQLPDKSNYELRKSHAKILTWTYKRHSMDGTWRFELVPESTLYIPAEFRKNVTVRYGCAIMLQASEKMLDDGLSVTAWCRKRIRRYGGV